MLPDIIRKNENMKSSFSKKNSKRIVYSCPYIPAEWIASHGLEPSRISPGIKERIRPIDSAAGICPYLSSFLNEANAEKNAAAVLFTTVCDQMRRAPECFGNESPLPLFLMHVPSTWKSVAAQQLYLSELQRLSLFLIRLGGAPPSREMLSQTMMTYDKKRNALRETKGWMHPRAYSEAIARFHRTGEVVQNLEKSDDFIHGVPIVLIGGPLTAQDLSLFNMIQDAGGTVVLDGTETGERTMPRPFHRQYMREDPLLELADAYFGHIPDAFRRPNSELFLWMRREFQAGYVRGVILVRNIWCDVWHAEVTRIREWLHLPLLDIDLNGENPVSRNKTRINAFLELLQ